MNDEQAGTGGADGADSDEGPGSRFHIEVEIEPGLSCAVNTVWIAEQLRRVAWEMGLRRGEAMMVIVGDETMSQMHVSFSGVEGTTDVLTFDLKDDEDQLKEPVGFKALGIYELEGEIYACVDEAGRKAGELKHPVDHELLLYGVHGLLHLVGHDDHDPERHRLMHEEEDRLLRAIGLGAVYAVGAWKRRAGEVD